MFQNRLGQLNCRDLDEKVESGAKIRHNLFITLFRLMCVYFMDGFFPKQMPVQLLQ